jgi:hypothetical protein
MTAAIYAQLVQRRERPDPFGMARRELRCLTRAERRSDSSTDPELEERK